MLEKLPPILGHALIEQRAGLDKIAFHQVDLRAGTAAIEVRSLAFSDHAPLPLHYTADGEGLSPPIQWQGLPAEAAGAVLIVEDADAPTPQPLVHAIVTGLESPAGVLAEGALDSPAHEGTRTDGVGRNSLLAARWLPPDPPPGHGVHRYAFQVFALAPGFRWSEAPGREEVLEAVASFGLASGLLIGTYCRDGSVRLPTRQAVRAEPVEAVLPSARRPAGLARMR